MTSDNQTEGLEGSVGICPKCGGSRYKAPSPRLKAYIQDLEAETGELQERARIAEECVVETTEKASRLFAKAEEQWQREHERVGVLTKALDKERQEGAVLYAALMRYVNRDECDNDGPEDVCHYCQGIYAASIIPDGTFYEKGECDLSHIPEDERHLAVLTSEAEPATASSTEGSEEVQNDN